jgi:hypothetical protein
MVVPPPRPLGVQRIDFGRAEDLWRHIRVPRISRSRRHGHGSKPDCAARAEQPRGTVSQPGTVGAVRGS